MNKKKCILLGSIVFIIAIIGLILCLAFKNKNCDYKDLGKIYSMSYTDGKEKYELIKKGDSWYWEDREDLLLDDNFVEMQAKIAREELRIEKAEVRDSLEECGLKDTKYSLTLKDKKGRKITMHIGYMLSSDTYFVKVENKKGIYTASWEVMEVIDNLMVQRANSEEMIYIE